MGFMLGHTSSIVTYKKISFINMYRNLVRPLSQALGRLVKFTAGLMSPNNVIWQSGRNRTSGQPLQIRVLRIMFCTQVNTDQVYAQLHREITAETKTIWHLELQNLSRIALPLIFVLHFKCSVLILDKKNELYKTLACPLTSLALLVCSLLTRRVSHFVRTIERQSTTL